MRTIDAIEIEEYLDKLNEMPEGKAEGMVGEMSDSQSLIMVYLMAVENEVFSGPEREGFFYLGYSLWYIMQSVNPAIPLITEEEIEASEKNNFKMLDVFADETDEGITKLIEIIVENYNQPGLFGYVVESLMEEEDDDGNLLFNPDNSGIMLIYLKTIIDCLDKY